MDEVVVSTAHEMRRDYADLFDEMARHFKEVDGRLQKLEEHMSALRHAMMSDELLEGYLTGGMNACRPVWQERVRRLEALA